MNRQKIRNAYENVRPDEETKTRMLENILSASSEIPSAGKDDTMKRKRMRPLILVAIMVLSVFLMGSAVIIRLTLATAPEYPLIEPASIPYENIHLSVSNVTPTSMWLYCEIDGITEGVNDVFIQCNGPFIIEKRTDAGWEQLNMMQEDPTWDAEDVRTEGSTDWHINWSTLYGVLECGTYRFTTTVLEGNKPVSVEFTVAEENTKDLSTLVNEILKSEYYHIRYTTTNEFGSTEKLSRDQKVLIESEYAGKVWTDEYWKLGEDLLNLSYRNEQIWTGMMYKNGIKYQLDHEGDDRSNPVSGWSPWPDGDMFWLTAWTSLLSADINTLEIEYSDNGDICRVTRSVYSEKFEGSYDVEVTLKEEWVFTDDDPAAIAAKFAEQNTDTALEFLWSEDVAKMKALDVELLNTSANPVSNATEAIDRAMAECTVEYDKILVYRDEEAGMWKVEFQIEYGYQGYQFIYLNDEGITQMVSGAGSKVEAWKHLYPDP